MASVSTESSEIARYNQDINDRLEALKASSQEPHADGLVASFNRELFLAHAELDGLAKVLEVQLDPAAFLDYYAPYEMITGNCSGTMAKHYYEAYRSTIPQAENPIRLHFPITSLGVPHWSAVYFDRHQVGYRLRDSFIHLGISVDTSHAHIPFAVRHIEGLNYQPTGELAPLLGGVTSLSGVVKNPTPMLYPRGYTE